MTIKTDKTKPFHDLNYYEECVALEVGNMFDLEWFEHDENKKELYSVKDIKKYIYLRYLGLKESLDEDSSASLEKQIRRLMKKNFNLPKNDKSYKYVIDEAKVIYLVNELLGREYLENLVFPDVSSEQKYELVKDFYKLSYGKNWKKAFFEDFKKAKKDAKVE